MQSAHRWVPELLDQILSVGVGRTQKICKVRAILADNSVIQLHDKSRKVHCSMSVLSVRRMSQLLLRDESPKYQGR